MIQHRLKSDLFGLTFAGGSPAEILHAVEAQGGSAPRQIVTANLDHVVTLSENAAFREAYAGAAARTLDGMPLVWLSRLRGSSRASRVTGHDLLATVLDRPAAADRRIFMLCASDAAGGAVARRLAARGYPPEHVVFEVPPHGFEADERYGAALAARIRRHGTTLLVMGVGAPKSEIWVHRQGPALGRPVVLCVGEALNVAAGLVARAPRVLQVLGLEWLFRVAMQPRRLFHRYFVRSWRFLALALRDTDLAAMPQRSRPAGLRGHGMTKNLPRA